MKIVDIETTTVSIPYAVPTLVMPQACAMGRTRTIVQVYTDEGIVGLGEFPAEYEEQFRRLKSGFINEDPFNLTSLKAKMGFSQFTLPIAGAGSKITYAGIEMACWDIMGKATNQPVYNLIGGRCREEIPFSAYIFPRYPGSGRTEGEQTPEQIVKLAESRVEEYGFKTVKLKGGLLSPKKDIETIRLMREGFGEDIALRIDPQWMWTPQQALQACKELDKYNLEYIEDPTETLTGMSMVRRYVKTPFSTDGWIFSIWPEMFKINAMLDPPGVDIVLSDAHYYGGISGVKELLATCNAMQLGLAYHTFGEFGISTAAIVQFAATVPTLQYALDTCYPEPPDGIIKEGWKFNNGCLKVPDKPGLGVELDENKVEKYHELYKREGLYKWYLDPFKPGWTPKIGEFRWEDYPVETDRYQGWLKASNERGYSVEKW